MSAEMPPGGIMDGRLVEETQQADVVRRMLSRYLETRSYNGVARELQEQGVRAPRGKTS